MEDPLITICAGYEDDNGQKHPCPDKVIIEDNISSFRNSEEVMAFVDHGIIDVLMISGGVCLKCAQIMSYHIDDDSGQLTEYKNV